MARSCPHPPAGPRCLQSLDSRQPFPSRPAGLIDVKSTENAAKILGHLGRHRRPGRGRPHLGANPGHARPARLAATLRTRSAAGVPDSLLADEPAWQVFLMVMAEYLAHALLEGNEPSRPDRGDRSTLNTPNVAATRATPGEPPGVSGHSINELISRVKVFPAGRRWSTGTSSTCRARLPASRTASATSATQPHGRCPMIFTVPQAGSAAG